MGTDRTGGAVRRAHSVPEQPANPFLLVLAAGTLCMTVLLVARATGLAPAPAPWGRVARRRAWWLVGLLATASWAFQLHRFGWV